jgi:transposase
MGQNFVACDREQVLLLPPSLREWLPEGHLAWFVIDAVEAMNLDAFFSSYRADGHGRAALDPSMMLALLLYAYSTGQRSSRVIERRCSDDVAFRVIAANQTPDHATIARFRVRHEQALSELFGEVLALCAKAGLVSVGVIALDGTKLHANASDRANRDCQRIAEEILAEADQVDAEEDAMFGERRGDELPAELSNSNDRRQRLRDARHALEAERAARQRPVPGDRQGRLLLARDRLAEDHALESRVIEEHNAWRANGVARDGSRRMSRAPAQLEAPPAPTGHANTTDPDSRKVKATRGYLQGYNAQAVTTEQQIVIAAELTVETDVAQLAPMIGHAGRELTAAGIDQVPETVLADAGY